MTKKSKQDITKQGIPPMLSSFHLEANRSGGGMSLILSGIVGVSDFSDELITLLSHGGRICVSGSKLFICLYENNSIEIEGRVKDITFIYGKN